MRLIDVVIFTFPNDAAVLESILLAEKIEYFINNPESSIIVPGSGLTISVKENDLNKAIAIIKKAGFEKNLLTDNQ